MARCEECDTELVEDENGDFYCPSSTCPVFMVEEDEDEDEEEDDDMFVDDEDEDE